MSEWAGRSDWAGDPAEGGAVVAWVAAAASNLTALALTTWTSADEGTSPAVGGVTFDVIKLASGSATVGNGAGLLTTNSDATIGIRFGADLSTEQPLAVVVAIGDDGPGMDHALAVGDVDTTLFPDESWRLFRATSTTMEVQRRTSTATAFQGVTRAADTITAVALICTMDSTAIYYRTDVVDPAALPAPPPTGAGWTLLEAVSIDVAQAPAWPITGANGGVQFRTDGSVDWEITAIAAYRWGA